ncbi:MAG: hypothetical protein IJX25_01625 [Clostridia bacterium]|nr:hypothetical protein [Clostridia bacterium]
MIKFNKIVIVSLCDSFTNELAKSLAQNLDMIFCDTKDLVEYELINKDAIVKMCSKEYLEQSERKVLKHIASFENVLVAINYDYLSKHYDVFNDNGLIIYLSLPKNYLKDHANKIDLISYEKRSNNLRQISNLSLILKKIDINHICLKILEKLRSLL